MISESKFGDSFPEEKSLIVGYHVQFTFGKSRNGGGVILYVREDVPAKLLFLNFPVIEVFFKKSTFTRKKAIQMFYTEIIFLDVQE